MCRIAQGCRRRRGAIRTQAGKEIVRGQTDGERGAFASFLTNVSGFFAAQGWYNGIIYLHVLLKFMVNVR